MMHYTDREDYESAVTEGSDIMHDILESDSAVLTDGSDE
jgi:hypothetical protein